MTTFLKEILYFGTGVRTLPLKDPNYLHIKAVSTRFFGLGDLRQQKIGQ